MSEAAAGAAATVGRSTLVELATRAVRSELVNGQLPPGSRIHLGETATRLGMSPIPVREALRTLATEGLVVSLPHRGYRVPEVSLADLEDTYRLRLVLDPMAVELAVPNLTEDNLARVEEALRHLERALRASDWAEIRAANREFHFLLYEASGSAWLLKMISMLWESSERYQRLSYPLRGTPAQRSAEHRGILEACCGRDARRAADMMHAHLNRTYTMARKALGAEE